MRNPICKVILSTCLLSSTAITAIGQSTQENTTKCQSADPDAKIAGCTALIQADQDTIKNRALIYGSRGVGYYEKGEYDHAIQDTAQAIHLNPDEPSFYYTSGLASSTDSGGRLPQGRTRRLSSRSNLPRCGRRGN